MTETKYTPGPWKLDQQEKWPFQLRIDSANGQRIVEMHRWAYCTRQKTLADCLEAIGFKHEERPDVISTLQEQIANAHLIAASPRLLTACETALHELRVRCGYKGDEAAYMELSAAIAEATGRAA